VSEAHPKTSLHLELVFRYGIGWYFIGTTDVITIDGLLTVMNILVPLYFLREDRKASQKTTFSKSFKASIVMSSVVCS
jgi:hypothetical protein